MAIPRSHILYVEDHEDTRELVTLVLAESNCRVTTTCSIKDALKLAREQRFDLYLIDSWLPDGTGIDLCKKLREFDDRTPIMFLSALAYEADKQAALDHGAQRYLVKPAGIQVLKEEVEELIAATRKPEREKRFARSQSPLCAGADRALRLGVFALEIVAP